MSRLLLRHEKRPRTLEANQRLQTLYFQNISKGANKIKIQTVGNWTREDVKRLGMGLKTVQSYVVSLTIDACYTRSPFTN